MASSTPMWTSKLGNRYPKDQIERLDQEHHRELKALRKLPHNARCAECGAGDTTWASVSLGVFVCVRCSDVHRAVGTHISKVKGCSGTYLWGPDEIARMREAGNAAAEELYGSHPRPAESASKEERVEACRLKYSQAQAAAPAPTVPRQAPCAAGAPAAPEAAVGAATTAARAAAAAPRELPGAGRPRVARALEATDAEDFFQGFFDASPKKAPVAPAPAAGIQAPSAVAAAAGAAGLDDFLDLCLGGKAAPAPAPARQMRPWTSDPLLEEFLSW